MLYFYTVIFLKLALIVRVTVALIVGVTVALIVRVTYLTHIDNIHGLCVVCLCLIVLSELCNNMYEQERCRASKIVDTLSSYQIELYKSPSASLVRPFE